MKNIAYSNMYFYKRSDENIDILLNDLIQIRLSICKTFFELRKSMAYQFYQKLQPIRNVYKTYAIYYNVHPENNDIFKIHFNNVFTYQPQNFCEMLITIFVDIMLINHRNDYLDNMRHASLESAITNLKSCYETFDNSFAINLVPIECEIFYEFIEIIQEICISCLNVNKTGFNHLTDLYLAFLPILGDIQELLVKNAAIEQLYIIDLCFLIIFFRIPKVYHSKSYYQIYNDPPSRYQEYFDICKNENDTVLICANILFNQLLVYLNLSITDNEFLGNIKIPILKDARNSDRNIFMNRYTFENLDWIKQTFKLPEYLSREKNTFIILFYNAIESLKAITEITFLALIKKLESTSDNYDNPELKFCYLMLNVHVELDDPHKNFIASDAVFAKHIKNSASVTNFLLLCDFVLKYVRKAESVNLYFRRETLGTFQEAFKLSRSIFYSPHDLIKKR